ncbi:hypothetical protein COT62_01065 [Candidatus Roizmanbacteria bacterium CG09_land_8_20_14_0_10_41_9]|uniref:Uncharacterized protein n=1 Tax=Candidatus Roizmanbacteria bacterium CG09_land_8_20_14_0_10_41_9 TaxID=1974850 RepID=A0A2H0WTD5_9BACT|nr:MAG: hypothetical protein COT62_01065 [Candidatus Roizmanbacteria bacterium CG09_land_8_20_14_0_10_41_9]
MVYADFTIDETTFPPARIGNIGEILNTVLPLLMLGAALLFLVMFLFAGFQWLTAGGSTDNTKKAQKTMTFAVLGLVIVVISYTAVKLIGFILQIRLPF